MGPDHPANVHPGSGVAFRVTVLSVAKLAAQVAPQSIPVGSLETLPAPTSATVTG